MVIVILEGANLAHRLYEQIRLARLPEPEREVRFVEGRKFRFDLAYTCKKLAFEVEGGTWMGGRHTMGAGYRRDISKYNFATLNGWRLFRFTTDMVRDGSALALIETVLKQSGWKDDR